MSKRRGKGDEAEAPAPETVTPEERRAQRKRERIRKKAGHEASTKGRPWRRVALIGSAVAVVAVIVAVLLIINVPTPCITLQPVPATSGVPAFPAHTTTDFTSTWCPVASEVYGTAPVLSIDILGNVVSIPGSIGRNNSYPGQYQCDLPVLTEPTSSGLPTGTISILSDWNYAYNLSTFFDVWSESYSAVAVSASNTSQPIVYQSNDILGYTSNATDTVRLFVDNQPSSKGPLLEISTLDDSLTTYPSCLGHVYGQGHRIMITYTNTAAKSSFVPLGESLRDDTAPADPLAAAYLFYGPLPHLGFDTPVIQGLGRLGHSGLVWLALRGASG